MNPKALLIGFRDNLKLAFYLDYLDNQAIYISYGNEFKMTREEFTGLVNFLRVAKQTIKPEKLKGPPGVISPKSMSTIGFIWLQENGYIKIEHRAFTKVFSQENYFTFVEELEAAMQGLDRFDKIQEMTPDARAAMGIDEAGRPLVVKDALYTIRMLGYAMALILVFLDGILLVAGIFNPLLLYLVVIIALVIVDAYLLLPSSEKKALSMFWHNAKNFMNEDFWRIADGLPISRKTVELFMVLLIVMTLMSAYFSTAIPSILSWGRKMFAGAPPDSSGTEDVTRLVAFTKKGGTYYDADKKFVGMSEFYKQFFDALSTCRLTLRKFTATSSLGGNLASLNHDLEGELMTSNFGDTQTFATKMRQYKPIQDAKIEKFSNYFAFKVQSTYYFSNAVHFKRMKPGKTDKKSIDSIVMRAHHVIAGPSAKIIGGTYTFSSTKDKNVYEKVFTIRLKNFDEIIRFISTIEAEPACLEFLVDEIVSDMAGSYDMRFRVIVVSRK
ncbi:MAG TPA: hypothetical protein PKK26_01215 [Candidatus Wallbacteria bacterium]|nr:hypothetical protein [Candidatus Wallbacteria bacterium]